MAEKIASSPPCSLDSFSQWFLGKYAGAELQSEAARSELEAIASASAAWVCSELVRREADFATLAGKQTFRPATSRGLPDRPRKRKSTAAPEKRRKKRATSGGGGPFRAFISKYWHEDPDYGSLARKCALLSEDQRAHFAQFGKP